MNNLKAEGKAFTLDQKYPTGDFRAFLMRENRFSALKTVAPSIAEELFAQAEEDAKQRFAFYQKLQEG